MDNWFNGNCYLLKYRVLKIYEIFIIIYYNLWNIYNYLLRRNKIFCYDSLKFEVVIKEDGYFLLNMLFRFVWVG